MGAEVSWWSGCMSLWGWEVTGAWAVVALAVDAWWVVGCGVVSLDGWWMVSSELVKLGATFATNTAFPTSDPSPGGRTEVEAVMASMPVSSRVMDMTVRSPMSFQVEVVCCDKVISCRAPARPEAELVGVGKDLGLLDQPHAGCEDDFGEDPRSLGPHSKLILP